MLQVSMSFPKAIQGGKYLDIYLVDYIIYIYIYTVHINTFREVQAFKRCIRSCWSVESQLLERPLRWELPPSPLDAEGCAGSAVPGDARKMWPSWGGVWLWYAILGYSNIRYMTFCDVFRCKNFKSESSIYQVGTEVET